MAIDPQVQQVLDRAAAADAPPLHEQTVEQARAAHSEATATLAGPPEDVGAVLDRAAPGPEGDVAVRVYVPQREPLGIVVFFHGGGWVVGTLDSYDSLCRALANAAQSLVVSVDYRLAPEHPFPAAVEDAWSALVWAGESATALGAPAGRLVVAGDSAGANLAAVVARRARDRGDPRIALQLLVYPVIDAAMDTPSYTESADGYHLEREGMRWFWYHYLAGADPADPDASPLRAEDVRGVAPALVITVEHDPLRDEGEAYAQRLEDAGVDVTLRRYDGLTHGVLRWRADVDAAHTMLDHSAAAIRSALAS